MSEQRRKLYDILILCILRYGLTEDSRFALAALVACQALPVPRSESVGHAEARLAEIQDRVLAAIPSHSRADESYATLAAFVRSMGLAQTLKGDKVRLFERDRAVTSLRRLAPQLARAIETRDLRLAHNVLRPDLPMNAVA